MSEVTYYTPSLTPELVLTPAAQKHILSYLQQKSAWKGIRFSVKKTGCSGLSYVVNYVDAADADDITLPLMEGYIVCIEKKSYPFLKGVEVDYVKTGLNAQFVFKNPNQTGQCGCGESFTVD